MDAYPEDLLVGVSPLVFAVNAISDPHHEALFARLLDALVLHDSSDDGDDNDNEERRRSSLPGLGRLKRNASSTSHPPPGFFRRARFESISTTHGFPPPANTAADTHDGILPAGWLETQVHALPSVILVVCTVQSSQSEQAVQDQHLYDTMEHLHESLPPHCHMHIVGIPISNNLHTSQGDAWAKHVLSHMTEGDTVPHDVHWPLVVSTLPSLDHTARLHQALREASHAYYRQHWKEVQAQQEATTSPLLHVRYAFQLALWNECLQPANSSTTTTEESWQQAYEACVHYYELLLGKTVGDPEGVEVHNQGSLDEKAQCWAVADWLLVKLLSSKEHWRDHVRTFRRGSGLPDWYEWTILAKQRALVGEWMERQGMRESWRLYESAVEAYLSLARCVEQTTSHPWPSDAVVDPMRARYLGCLDEDAWKALWNEQKPAAIRDKALELCLRSISLFEKELEQDKRGFYAEDEFRERSSSRTGARLYYLAGGILVGAGKHQEATPHLQNAAKYARGWRELELAIRRMLIECYEKHIPTPAEAAEGSQTLVSMILDSYFNAEMSAVDLRKALSHFASLSDGDCLKWYHDSMDEEGTDLPLSFQITFPENVFATIGDSVKACVLLKSNLDYAVHVNSVVLQSLAGDLPIPVNDLLSASNASEGTDGKGIIIQRHEEIQITTRLSLPRDLSFIASDVSGNGGEALAKAGKGSFAKNARPRTAGITSAGGARLVSEEALSKGNAASQGWSTRFLGGKPLRCDGMRVEFYPVQVEKATGSSDGVTLIELTIEKKKRKTAVNIKRTPFEEENYVASAWSRSPSVPLALGPRSLRVMGPRPSLVVTNLTDPETNSNALEGTVNRVVLKLQAGSDEKCVGLSIKVSCFSVLLSEDGVTTRLVAEEKLEGSEDAVDMKKASYRTPCLVQADASATPQSNEFGYDVPSGWRLAESGQSFSLSDLPALDENGMTYVPLDFYRPAPFLNKDTEGGAYPATSVENQMCRTDFYVTISYQQKRPQIQKPKTIRRTRSVRRRPSKTTDDVQSPEPAEPAAPEESADSVSMEYSGSLMWSKPLSATFAADTSRLCPSGSRFQSNLRDGEMGPEDPEYAVVDGDRVPMRCTITSNEQVDELATEISSVRFEKETNDPSVELSLKAESETLFEPKRDDPSRILSGGSKFRVAYAVEAKLQGSHGSGGVAAPLGAILVDWVPSPLELPEEVQSELDGVSGHGPLSLGKPATIRFTGPICYVERAPFRAELLSMPTAPKVMIPFELNFRIQNQTNEHQALAIRLADEDPDGVLMAGLTRGQLTLSPREDNVLTYTLLATRAGSLALPSIEVRSIQYDALVIAASNHVPLWVEP